jgi:glycerol-3-phosphate dehydrogenase (NAD(P)+)
VGVEIGKGRKLSDILAGMVMVAEGVETTRSAYELAKRVGVEVPIIAEVHRILFEGKDPLVACHDLMTRDPKGEL